jgi:hypothetical protein
MPKKPTTAFVLSLIGGICVLAVGFASIVFGVRAYFAYLGGLGDAIPLFGVGILAASFGILMMFGGIRLNSRPQEHRKWGVVVLVFSILSWFVGAGEFIGFILGILGGVLGIEWKP